MTTVLNLEERKTRLKVWRTRHKGKFGLILSATLQGFASHFLTWPRIFRHLRAFMRLSSHISVFFLFQPPSPLSTWSGTVKGRLWMLYTGMHFLYIKCRLYCRGCGGGGDCPEKRNLRERALQLAINGGKVPCCLQLCRGKCVTFWK